MSIDSRRQALFEERLRAAGVRVADSGPAAGPRPERIPLSSAQQRFWVLEQLDPGNPALHMAAPVRLRGPLSADALGRGLNALVARHEVLRTVIETDPDGTGRQRVRPAADCPLPVVDLAGTPSGERAARLATISDEEARRPFDLRQGPLLRARLVRLDADDHVLLLTLHHIAGDGWSVGVLVDELAQLYRGAGPLAPLPLQYADFALWERQHLADAEQTAALDRVAGRLTGAPVLELPTDAPRGAVRTYRGARREWRADRALSQAVHRLSRQAGVSPFVVLLAGLTVVLSRQAGTDDVVVGAPVAGRHRPETAGLIGCFVNTVALRADLSGDPSFSALLHRVRDASLEAYAHQHVPFEAVLRRLHADRDPGRTPLFDVLVNMVDVPGGPVTLAPGLTAELGEPQEVGVKFDLTLYLRDLPAGFEFVASYNADLFGGARIEALLRQCGAVLAAATSAPQRRINRFDLRTPLPQLPRPGAPREPGPALLHERFSTVAARHPGRTALVTPTGDWSYRTLESRANQVAQALHARGARPGDPVAVHARRGPGLVAALLGVLKAGATVGVVDPDAPPAAVAQCLTVLRPAVVVDTTGGTVPGVPPAGVLALPDDAPWPLAGLADTVPDGIRSHPDDPAYVFFTSGTTGAAKAVTGTHRPVAHFLDVQRETFGLTATDRFALLAGLGHDPLLRDVFAPLSLGAPLCVPGPAPLGEQQDLAAWLDTAGVTVAHLTPALARFVVATSLSGSLPLRYAFLGGEAISATDVARLAAIAPGVRCVSVYGTTETPQVMTWQEVRADGPARPPIGTGIDGVTVRLLNPAGEPCGVGELGELFLETPWLTLGYRDRPGLTADRFRPAHDPATPGARGYATGDLGRLGPDGSIVYSGRADRQLSVDGHRVEPAEIEAVLATHPGVREVTVTADRIAHVAAGTGMDGSGLADELRLLAARRLPRHLRPAGYAVHERLPRTNHGKLDHRALTATAPRVAEGQAPRTAPERLIAERMAAVLGVPVFSDTDFFAAGGDSLQAMRLVRELGERGHEVALAAVFECPSPALLAPRLGDGGATPDRPRPRPAGEVVPLSWAQQRLWFLDQLHPGSTAYNIPITIAIDGPLDTHRLT
ncbi:non-ribosomal peptide synthetase, partial [Jidongwangia harbinensis]|uniref:non-ribosomal peptide synthetase n=1 Tax=Jidongwangia harbinensis TaxID=2878561 RepID=UPI001CD9C1EE